MTASDGLEIKYALVVMLYIGHGKHHRHVVAGNAPAQKESSIAIVTQCAGTRTSGLMGVVVG